MKQRLALLGSTGSIGQQTLDIVRQRPDEFEVTTLTAARSWERLVEQAKEFGPDNVVIADKSLYRFVSEALRNEPVKVYAGDEALSQVVPPARWTRWLMPLWAMPVCCLRSRL